jgi:CubicO group peptidase (beta-lactamase class C family)
MAAVSVANADWPVSGKPVSELSAVTNDMLDFLNDNDIESAILGISRNGTIIYLRGFGYLDGDVELQENTMWRLASVNKTLTAAATQRLIKNSAFSVDDKAFNVSGNGGVLSVNPWGGVGDSRIKDITIKHLLVHQGGWDRGEVGDWTYNERDIADDMGVDSPPGRTRTLDWILGNSLQFKPGTDTQYSNIGFLSLGLIIEQESGSGLLTYFRNNIVTPNLWVEARSIRQGRTFRDQRDSREPWYREGGLARNVFDNKGDDYVNPPYGSWDHEARIGQGGIIATAATMLTFADNYRVGVYSTNIGKLRSDAPLSNGTSEAHNGSLRGLDSDIWHRTKTGEELSVFVAFNDDDENGHFGDTYLYNRLIPILDNISDWPSEAVDGAWVKTNGNDGAPVGVGSYESPFSGIGVANSATDDGAKWRLRRGTSLWTGTINKKVRIDAPEGKARIGG